MQIDQLEEFTEEELERAAGQAISDRLGSGITVHERPRAFLIVGQPGAGKTTLASIFTNQMEQDIVFVSGDDYRGYHPRHDELHASYGDDAVLHTQRFAGKMTETIIDRLSSKGCNLIIEGTLRTREVPEKTCRMLKERGYEVTLAALLVRPEVSYLSTLKRYELMKRFGNSSPRMTPKEHHDKVVASLAGNMHAVYKDKVFDNIQIYNRNEDLLYDVGKMPRRDPGDIIEKEFSRSLPAREKQEILKSFRGFVEEKRIRNALMEYARGVSR